MWKKWIRAIEGRKEGERIREMVSGIEKEPNEVVGESGLVPCALPPETLEASCEAVETLSRTLGASNKALRKVVRSRGDEL